MVEQVESFGRILGITDAVEALVYNSLEARSTSIAIHVHVDKFKFQVVDNGVGINAGQARNIAAARSTNDIKSLSAVIRLAAEATIEARQQDMALGYRLMINKEGTSERLITRDYQGTTVTIKGLFSMLPARQKGINIERELRKLTNTIQLLYIANPSVAFLLFDRQSERPLFKVGGVHCLDEAFQIVYGDIYRHKLERLNNNCWIGVENHCTNELQVLYNNRKIVHDEDLLQNISKRVYKWRREKCKSRRRAGFCYPVFVLCFNHEPELLKNVNRLMDDTFPLSAMAANDEPQGDNDRPLSYLGGKVSFSTERENPTASSSLPVVTDSSDQYTKSNPFFCAQFLASIRKEPTEHWNSAHKYSTDCIALMERRQPISSFIMDRETLRATRAIAQFDDKFILCKVILPENNGRPSKLLVFDQHAISERILLERLLNGVNTIRLSAISIDQSFSEHVQQGQYGVEWHESNGYALVQTLPLCFLERRANRKREEALHFVQQLVNQLSEISITPTPRTLVPVVRSAFNEWACKAAVKFGDHLNIQYCQYLVDQLASCQTPFCCAHGRRSFFQLYDFDHFEMQP